MFYCFLPHSTSEFFLAVPLCLISSDFLVPAGRPGAQVPQADLLHAELHRSAVHLCQPLLPRRGPRPTQFCLMNLTLPKTRSAGALGLFHSACHRTLTLPQRRTLEWDLELGPKQKGSMWGSGGLLEDFFF